MEIRSYSDMASPKLEGRTVEGFAAVFDQESLLNFDAKTKQFFIEVIERGAIADDLLRACDVKALLEHDKGRMLARSRFGAGSLSLMVNDFGLGYKFDAPNTPEGDYAVEMIARGDLFGSSFAYSTNDKKNVTYKKVDGLLYRIVHKIDRIFDISIVSDPAYYGTDVTLRSLGEIDQTLLDNHYKEQINNLRKFI